MRSSSSYDIICLVDTTSGASSSHATRSASETRFAHPVEQELARLFDEHGIDWLYEPHTFVLEQDPDGTVRQAFKRLRPASGGRCEGRGSKKGVTVEILYGRDIERLARRWSLVRMKSAAAAKRIQGFLRDWNPR